MYDHNNLSHLSISLEKTRANTFWPDHNFVCYLVVSEVNTALSSGHFQNYGLVQPSLDFWRALKIYFLDNTIGVGLGGNRPPKRACKIP